VQRQDDDREDAPFHLLEKTMNEGTRLLEVRRCVGGENEAEEDEKSVAPRTMAPPETAGQHLNGLVSAAAAVHSWQLLSCKTRSPPECWLLLVTAIMTLRGPCVG
jgi:hypothetical protein